MAGVLVVVLGTLWRSAITRNRSVPSRPFQIAGNLYHVGHTGMAAFLLTGPEGHVLIDGGYPENAPLIMESIAELGFDIADVRVLLNSHPHSDHAESSSLYFLHRRAGGNSKPCVRGLARL